MTVCIAAIAENGKKVVLATDKMITANAFGGYEVDESGTKKIIKLSDNTRFLLSGSTPFAIEIAESAKKKIHGTKSVRQIAELVKEEYHLFRKKWIEEGILIPRGIKSLEDYYSQHQKLQPTLTQQIDQLIAQANNNFQVQIMVVGFDADGCSMFVVNNNLPIIQDSMLGYSVVGSGENIAGYVLLDSGYNKSLDVKKVEELVKIAKNKSEKAQGVGRETDIEVLDSEKK